MFATNREHSAFHKNGIYWIDQNGIAHSPLKQYKCERCGALISKGKAGRLCVNCRLELNQQQRLNSVSREELKKLIRSVPFTEIGRMFNVCDNTIRKWCKKYNLPFRTKDIKAISDEDWLNL